MCASYGIDPRFDDDGWLDVMDATVIDELRGWAERNGDELLWPTGTVKRNRNPLFTELTSMAPGWWGYLEGGKPASFTSIWTRAERLHGSRDPIGARAIVPVTFWRELKKPERLWHHYDRRTTSDRPALLGMAAVIRPGRTADGQEHLCYSLVMQPAAPHLEDVHHRMPLLVPPGFAEEWLTSMAPASELIDAARAASAPLSASVTAHPHIQAAKDDRETLF